MQKNIKYSLFRVSPSPQSIPHDGLILYIHASHRAAANRPDTSKRDHRGAVVHHHVAHYGILRLRRKTGNKVQAILSNLISSACKIRL